MPGKPCRLSSEKSFRTKTENCTLASVVIDIETVGFPFESFDEAQQEYLLKYAETKEEREEAIQRLGLHPLTAQVVAIAMLNPDTQAGKVFYQAPGGLTLSGDEKIESRAGTERELLEWFWESVQRFDQLITFNGRGFDCPFLMLRSAVLGVRPSRNLLSNRYDVARHCDLLEQFSFYGTIRKFNLDFYCRAFGVGSPKIGGVSGEDVGELFQAKRYDDIAAYCLRDVRATAELYRRWNEFLNLKD